MEYSKKIEITNKRLMVALAITLIAGGLIGFGIGAQAQYKVSVDFLTEIAETGGIFEIKGQGFYTIEPVNTSLNFDSSVLIYTKNTSRSDN